MKNSSRMADLLFWDSVHGQKQVLHSQILELVNKLEYIYQELENCNLMQGKEGDLWEARRKGSEYRDAINTLQTQLIIATNLISLIV